GKTRSLGVGRAAAHAAGTLGMPQAHRPAAAGLCYLVMCGKKRPTTKAPTPESTAMRSGSGEKKAAATTAAAPISSSRKPIWIPVLPELPALPELAVPVELLVLEGLVVLVIFILLGDVSKIRAGRAGGAGERLPAGFLVPLIFRFPVHRVLRSRRVGHKLKGPFALRAAGFHRLDGFAVEVFEKQGVDFPHGRVAAPLQQFRSHIYGIFDRKNRPPEISLASHSPQLARLGDGLRLGLDRRLRRLHWRELRRGGLSLPPIFTRRAAWLGCGFSSHPHLPMPMSASVGVQAAAPPLGSIARLPTRK